MARRSTHEFGERLEALVLEYCGRLSIAEVIGVLVVQIMHIHEGAGDDEESNDD